MDALVQYFSDGHSVTDLLLSIIVIIAIIVSIEKAIQWIYGKFLLLYKTKKGYEDETTTINDNTEQIKNLVMSIDNLGTLLNKQYQHLDKKIDEQKERITKIDEDGKRRDCAILRDRIIQSMRFFSKNKDTNDIIHIGITDYENLEELFSEYFKCGGNGVCHSLYENEFKKFKIDTSKKY